jgi:hypothetical protein
MGYVTLTAPCIRCKALFSFNPVRVPSIRIDGTRYPICQACIPVINEKRKEAGVEEIVPAPDAYEAVDEAEINWGD